jgi:hypothetical protein
MAAITLAQWLGVAGIGAIWLGMQIVLNAGLPRLLRRGEVLRGEPGSMQAFMLFWLDQYSFIGITLTIAGLALTLWGFSR